MMRFLVVYFSYTGNNRLLAAEIARRLQCKLCAIVEKKRRTMLSIILDMMFRRTPRIEPLGKTLSEYDHIVFVAPVWDSKVANPMQALLKRDKATISSYSFITLCGYERAGQLQSIEKQLCNLVGTRPKAAKELRIRELLPVNQRNEIKDISRYRVAGSELTAYENAISTFLAEIRAET
ncbi:MAG: flavodoxin family protein [Gammaproteobacteria bacterium]